MKILAKIDNVKNNIWNIDNNIIILKDNTLINLDTKRELNYKNDVIRCFYSNNYIYFIKKNELVLLNVDFTIVNTINQSNATGLSIFDENNYVIWFENEDGDEYYSFYKENNAEGTADSFFGKFLDISYSYRFKKRKERSSFVLSNLLNTNTYFEYKCEPHEEIAGDIIKYKGILTFYTREIEKELYDSKYWINVLDIKTRQIIYKILVEHYGANFNYKKGQFVSIQATNQNNKIVKSYEILNINNGVIQRDNFKFNEEMFSVGTAVQYIDNNKLYFVDNVYSYEEQKKKSPKIGCFNVETKQIDFFEELKEAEGFSINQIISKNDLIYVKTDNNEVFTLKI
ncbi:hypothetical protein ASE40_18265 [Flavobacterium sp. Root935]|jgi:hypothetical protein|uniref:hypothetical protein n=1 Tax=unclassified Flavobacterium TaxID=196869 RepID=UPI00070CF65A|nr:MULTISPECIES: hypothetical protein [unclassified Flavobacterium]KRD58278.1 hypothetical protein ASE40_18265 [Flavobacterium sp. Root935]TDX11689.1 hypothetical protein EDB96_2480 [Flavobacterium sp. S87F.05.LMB.W.Kidney.N]